MRLIDADALIDTLGISDEEIDFKEILLEAPTIDAVSVIHGEWLVEFQTKTETFYRCSKCNVGSFTKFPFCFSCGAKMDGEREGE